MPQAKHYRIVIGGELGELLSGAFENVTLERRDGQTILATGLMDESALYGLLDRLRDFAIELVSLGEMTGDKHAGTNR